jgi:hypothetical protein
MTTRWPESRRWDIDEVGHGVGSGEVFAPDAARLLDALQLPDWVAEDPDAHLLPHIRAACEAPDAPWLLLSAEVVDAVLDVTLHWNRAKHDPGSVRGDALALIGSFAEASTHIRQRWTGQALEYDVATGMLEGDGEFAPHGHLATIRVVGPRVTRHG